MCQEIVKFLPEVYFATMLAGNWSKMGRQCSRTFSHFRIASGRAQNGNTSATKIMCQEIVKLLPEVYFETMLAGKLAKMHRQCFRMFAHLRIASGTAQNCNTSATKIMGQKIMKFLPELYFEDRLARKLSQMRRQSFRMLSHFRIASGTAQNGNTSANKIMGQEIMKLLPEIYFEDRLAGNLSQMRRQSFKTFSHFRIASGTAQNGNTTATKIMCQEIVKLLPEVYFTTMLARNWSKMRRQCSKTFSHFRIALGMAQNGNTSATKIMCQEIVKFLPEVYFATMLAGDLSKMRRQSSTMFSHLQIAFGTAQNGNTSATKIMGQEIMKFLPELYFEDRLAGKLSQMRRQSFRTCSDFRIASGTAQNGNTSATKIMCQEIVKFLPEVYFATMLAGNWSKMGRQCSRTFSHFRIASGTAQNGNTSATKIMGQDIMKLLPEIYFEDRLAGKLSAMRRQWFKMFSYLRIASGTAQNGNTSATKIISQEIVLEVFLILAGILSSICRQCFRRFPHTRIAFGTAQNAEKSAQNLAKNSFQMLFYILICLKTFPEISNA